MITTYTARDGSDRIVYGDYLATLKACDGYYKCPLDDQGLPVGPIVGYTGKDDSGQSYVGTEYLNFSMADIWPRVLEEFADAAVDRCQRNELIPDIILGSPWAGVKLSTKMAEIMGCRHVFAEKSGDDIVMGRYEGIIAEGDQVLIVDELINNMSTTGKLVALIEAAGGTVIGVACAINRSCPMKMEFERERMQPIPIVGVIQQSIPQYQQGDPFVTAAIAEYGLVKKPKLEWPKLQKYNAA